jgi:aspartate aminotransferase
MAPPDSPLPLARGPMGAPGLARLRSVVVDAPPQLIGEVAKLGMGDPDAIALWYGEGDMPTPKFICDAAHQAMLAGETFYTHKRGLPELQAALAQYLTDLYAKPVDMDRITVTSSGMHGILTAMQAILQAGDNAVVVGPVWPNAEATIKIAGATPRVVGLDNENGVWRLDLDALFSACDASTRVIFVNSPGNPTGWMLEQDEQQAILEFARARGIWVMADEVYARLVYDRAVAPSFLDIAEPEDALVVINSFSKSWAMTGWRVGWLTHPAWLGAYFAEMIEYSTSSVPPFLQKAALTAVTEGEDLVAEIRERCRQGKDIVTPALMAHSRILMAPPVAAFYAFFKVDGMTDSLDWAKRLYHETKVGIAPGSAFGPEGEGWIRLCFASSPARLNLAMDGLTGFLDRN